MSSRIDAILLQTALVDRRWTALARVGVDLAGKHSDATLVFEEPVVTADGEIDLDAQERTPQPASALGDPSQMPGD